MTQYNKISEKYVECNARMTKKYCITPSFLKYLGDIKDKKILDVGCGDGHYTRMMKKLGASGVVGVDISEGMIKLAREKEEKNPLGIKYFVEDARDMEKLGDFDIITATFLLHYSETKEELLKMCENIIKNLKKGGRFLAINENPECIVPKTEKYFVRYEIPKNVKEGDIIKLTLFREDKTIACSFLTYRWYKNTYNTILKQVGFKDINWFKPFISEEGKEKFGEHFWEEYLNPHSYFHRSH